MERENREENKPLTHKELVEEAIAYIWRMSDKEIVQALKNTLGEGRK